MEEYEYGFNVSTIQPFIEFCKKNNYNQILISKQNRKVYQSSYNSHLISRLTTNILDDKTETVFDFKLAGEEIEGKKLSQESESLIVTNDLMPFVKSALDVLGFKMVADNFRTRYVFTKDDITFEIDDYTTPDMKVVAVEGSKEKVEVLCNTKLKYLIKKYSTTSF